MYYLIAFAIAALFLGSVLNALQERPSEADDVLDMYQFHQAHLAGLMLQPQSRRDLERAYEQRYLAYRRRRHEREGAIAALIAGLGLLLVCACAGC
jgi:hypothetical protein